MEGAYFIRLAPMLVKGSIKTLDTEYPDHPLIKVYPARQLVTYQQNDDDNPMEFKYRGVGGVDEEHGPILEFLRDKLGHDVGSYEETTLAEKTTTEEESCDHERCVPVCPPPCTPVCKEDLVPLVGGIVQELMGSGDIRAQLQRYVTNYIGTHIDEFSGQQVVYAERIARLEEQNAKLTILLHRMAVKLHLDKSEDDL
jgi:hypothetical protein